MKKSLFLIAALTIGLCGFAQEFKVNDAKYKVQSNGTVTLVEYKKAKGDVIIPDKVTYSKTKNEYVVGAIDNYAFNGSKITSVVIPSSVETVGAYVFNNCKLLSKVTLPKNLANISTGMFTKCRSLKEIKLDGVKSIEVQAFSESGLESLTIPPTVTKIEGGAFYACGNLKELIFENGNDTISIANILYGAPLETLVLGRPYVYSGYEDAQNKPFCNNPALKRVTVNNPAFSSLPADFIKGCASIDELVINYDEPSQTLVGLLYSTTGNNVFILNDKKMNKAEARGFANKIQAQLDEAEYNAKMEQMFNEFEQLAYTDYVKALKMWDDDFKSKDKFYNIPVLKDMAARVTGKLVADMPEERYNNYDNLCRRLMAYYFSYMYGNHYLSLEEWSASDPLSKEALASGEHNADAEILLGLLNQFIAKNWQEGKNNTDVCYEMAEKLAMLCTLGRWKEAAAFFPKVHRSITDGGYYYAVEMPAEIDYMQKKIREHGYKVPTPKYGNSQSQSSSKKSSSDGLIESITEGVVNKAVDHYQKKKEEKRWRKMLYDDGGKKRK